MLPLKEILRTFFLCDPSRFSPFSSFSSFRLGVRQMNANEICLHFDDGQWVEATAGIIHKASLSGKLYAITQLSQNLWHTLDSR